MSITLNNSDFQCLQDQLVSLKTKNYELEEKTRRSQADFEAAKAKICTLQLKLEEQERDFQITSSTLRQEIQAVSSSNEADKDNENKENNLKTEELQQRYERSVEVAQQLDIKNQELNERIQELVEENSKFKTIIDDKEKQINLIESESKKKLKKTIEEYKRKISDEHEKHTTSLEAMESERVNLVAEIDKLTAEADKFESKIESQIEERKIQERKGLQIVKELKRQLALEKSRSETLQKRIETLLSEPPPNGSSTDLENPIRLSTSSSTNGNSSSSGSGNGSRANQDANSVGSWSFVPVKSSQKSSNLAVNDGLSICSIDSEDRETVQQPCDTKSQDSMQQRVASANAGVGLSPKLNLSASNSSNQLAIGSVVNQDGDISNSSWRSNFNSPSLKSDGLLIEEQAALVDRVTRLQHDKWTLEEKLSYLEQANSSLSKDLADKSDMIKHYFFNQAMKARNSELSDKYNNDGNPKVVKLLTNRRTSVPFNMNHLLSEKPNLKKVVDFLKERSQVSSGESENITREATKKMQLMLEETLIKCLKLQENLDHVTSELNKLKS